jgi:hypothetical protein
VKRTVILILTGALVVLGVTAGVLLRPSHGSAEGPEYGASPNSTFGMQQARSFSGWALYNPGDSFRGYALVAVLRTNVTNPVDPEVTVIRPNYVSFIYGDCLATDEEGCAPPLEVRMTPACRMTPDDIEVPDDGQTVIRGVPARFFDGGTKLMFVTGETTVSIYGGSEEVLVAAANALRGVNVALAAGAPLPPQSVTHRRGRPTC